jgi:hypothetical protein
MIEFLDLLSLLLIRGKIAIEIACQFIYRIVRIFVRVDPTLLRNVVDDARQMLSKHGIDTAPIELVIQCSNGHSSLARVSAYTHLGRGWAVGAAVAVSARIFT